MKKSVLVILMCVFGLSTWAQADVAVRLVSPANNGSITAGTQFAFDIWVKNEGNVAVTAQDSIIVIPLVNGSPLNNQGQALVFYEQTAIAAGDSANVTRNMTISGGSSGMINWCAFIFMRGPNWTGVSETDSTNNMDCHDVNYDAGSMSTGTFSVNQAEDNSYFANGTYFIDMEGYAFGQKTELRVYTLTGQEVHRELLQSNGQRLQQEVTMPALSRGVYIFRIADEKNIHSARKVVTP